MDPPTETETTSRAQMKELCDKLLKAMDDKDACSMYAIATTIWAAGQFYYWTDVWKKVDGATTRQPTCGPDDVKSNQPLE